MIKILEKIKTKKAVLVYPTIGFVGNILGEYLVDQLKPSLVAYSYFRENMTVFVANKKVFYPINIFYSKEKDFLLIFVSFPFFKDIWRIHDEVRDIVKKFGVKELIVFEAIVGSKDVLYFSQDTDYNIKEFKQGIINGLPATFVLEPLNIAQSTIFLKTDIKEVAIPNGMAAVEGISILDKLFNLNIDYSKLEFEAKELEKKVKAQIDKIKQKKQTVNYVG